MQWKLWVAKIWLFRDTEMPSCCCRRRYLNDMAGGESVELVLGFPDEEVRDFGRASFPSKIGGKPVFLLDVPADTPKCGRCERRMRFLCQLYAPVVAEHGQAFHRTLYVYFCDVAACSRAGGALSVAVLRAQLARRNGIYSFDGGGEVAVELKSDVCAVCGGSAVERCSACKCVAYCSVDCQRTDWKLGHKTVCKLRAEGKLEEMKRAGIVLEEARKRCRFREVAIGTEEWSDEESEDEGDEGVAEVKGTMQDAGEEELPEELFRGDNVEDEVFERFCRLTRNPPDQVVRYARGGKCVWMHAKGGREAEGGKCERCGGEMVFEFQVLPQAVYYAERAKNGGSIGEVVKRLRDSADWGVIAVFTCRESCEVEDRYVREQAWLQPSV